MRLCGTYDVPLTISCILQNYKMPLFLSDSNSVSFSCWGMEGRVGVLIFDVFLNHICDIEILAKSGPKIAKLVEITLQKHISPKFLRIRRSSWRAKSNSISYNKMWKKKKVECPEYNSIMQVIFY